MKRWTALLMMLALLSPAFARAETTLYYNSKGGKRYHADPQCETVEDRYLPMRSFGASKLNAAPYNQLEPCRCVLEGVAPTLYYNAEGGKNYHTTENCGNVDKAYLPLSSFPAIDIGQKKYAALTPCARCAGKKNVTLYYNANGGRCFHTAAACSAVDERYLPLTKFSLSDLKKKPYSGLTACELCRRRDEGASLQTVYYNPKGGRRYHEDPACSTVDKAYLPLRTLPGALRREAPFNKLERCDSCCK